MDSTCKAKSTATIQEMACYLEIIGLSLDSDHRTIVKDWLQLRKSFYLPEKIRKKISKNWKIIPWLFTQMASKEIPGLQVECMESDRN